MSMTPAVRLLVAIAWLLGCSEHSSDVTTKAASNNLLAPPTDLHWVKRGPSARLVFSRSEDDSTDRDAVHRYAVCFADQTCVETDRNFLDVAAGDETRSLPVSVYTVSPDGRRSPSSEVLGAADDLTEQSVLDTLIRPLNGGPEWACYGTPPGTVYAPVYGDFTVHGANVNSNITDRKWSFWQHRDGFHRDGGGINGSDDSFAWDINLNVRGAGSNMDRGADILSIGYGDVVNWGAVAPGAGATKAVFIDHCGWSSGYLHSSVVYVRAGDFVSPWTRIGKIGRGGATNDHLHVAVYGPPNANGVQDSHNVSFIENRVTYSLPPGDVALGADRSLDVRATLTHAADNSSRQVNLNAQAVYDNTWWKSSNRNILAVNGSGVATGVAPGQATVSLYYAGELQTRVYNVVAGGCALPPGHWDYCRDCGPCASGEGDCENGQCAAGLVCAQNVGADYGWDNGVDVCQDPGGAPNCPHPPGHWDYCRDCGPCASGEGDCEDGQCNPGLVCARNVGANYGWDNGVDVCQP